MTQDGYLLDNAAAAAGLRMDALAQLFDPSTFRRALRDAGLSDVAADAYFPVALPASAALERGTVAHIRDRLIASGRVAADDIERHLASVNAGAFDLATPPMISAWGRRPAEGAR